MKKAKIHYNDPTFIALSQETFKEHYEESHNPLHLMRAFIHATEYNIPVPQWVKERLSEVFETYMESPDEKQSLDLLLGCTYGPGQKPARTRDNLEGRNFDMLTAIDALHRGGMKVRHACIVAQALYRDTSPPDKTTLYGMYYSKRKALKRIGFYSFGWLTFSENCLKQIPQRILTKYPDILKEGPWPKESIF